MLASTFCDITPVDLVSESQLKKKKKKVCLSENNILLELRLSDHL